MEEDWENEKCIEIRNFILKSVKCFTTVTVLYMYELMINQVHRETDKLEEKQARVIYVPELDYPKSNSIC